VGTSASSRGPGGGVPLVPEWVPPATPPPPGQQPPDQEQQPQQAGQPATAPPRRFQRARTDLGQFARAGAGEALRRGLGHYSRTGLGGAAAAASRMGGTARTAGGLYGVLDGLSSSTPLPPDVQLDPTMLAGRSQREIADAVTDALRPIDGTQDTDAARDAMSRAFSELLEAEPTADLAALTAEQIDRVVEAYLANDLANRIDLDVGAAVVNKAPSAAEGVARLEEMKAYVRQEVARCFRAREAAGERMDRQNAAALASEILRDTFEIFESYL
jgi:hypothetical protein